MQTLTNIYITLLQILRSTAKKLHKLIKYPYSLLLISSCCVLACANQMCAWFNMFCGIQKRHELLKNANKDLTPTAIVEGNTIINSRRQLSQIIDTTLLKCYLQV
jgi:hypothetical protein